MAKKPSHNGHGRLEEAMTMLIQNQAAFLGRQAESDARFSRIEADIAAILRVLAEHSRLLGEHSELLTRLPDAVRDKIGFKAPQ